MTARRKVEAYGAWIAAAAFAVFASMAADLAGAATPTSIKDTKHNLGNTGTGDVHVTTGTGTSEVCVFCHTPHGANLNVQAPLWNRVPSTETYTLYSSTTLDGTPSVGGVSVACLSCHDGSLALDTMVNRPGSGLYDAAGVSAGYTWVGASGTPANKMPAGITNLGNELQNDHPIGMGYCGATSVSGTVLDNTNCPDKDFNATSSSGSGSATRWWVESPSTVSGAVAGSRDKTDMILYVRSSETLPRVECASCHDPHSLNVTFLRMPNDGSQLCLTCHKK